MKILLIRHGKTAGNLQKRYIGTTDESLCPAGIAELQMLHVPACEICISSPMQRCMQTAKLLFPAQEIIPCSAFRECNFGDFEGKCYAELNGNPQYQAWIDSGGTLPFPNGESPADFRRRCCTAFTAVTQTYANAESIAMIVHGGTIMSILAQYGIPHRDYYDWMTENAHGWMCSFDGQTIHILEKL